ncbi:hypothetical protein H6P81_017996 [Aristolochia fimbriata]|uniref:Uncharacterized protein n=1 Tax=Aristolochia fimbriata TaxID=158543 RepID=A0AAV7E2U5_ARIFI|nr:hypothetical protein H6P81_017996 [Aristolochia fimbriata]
MKERKKKNNGRCMKRRKRKWGDGGREKKEKGEIEEGKKKKRGDGGREEKEKERWQKGIKRKRGDGGREEKKEEDGGRKKKKIKYGGRRKRKRRKETEKKNGKKRKEGGREGKEKKKEKGRKENEEERKREDGKRRKREMYNSNNSCSFYNRRQSIAEKWHLKGLLQHFSSDLYNTVTLWQGEKKHYINEVSTVLAVLWELLTSCMPFEGFSTLQAADAGAFKVLTFSTSCIHVLRHVHETLISNFKAEPQVYAAHLLFFQNNYNNTCSFYCRRQSIAEKWHLKRRFQHFPSGKVQIFWHNYGRWFS